MFTEKRQKIILEILEKDGQVRASTLANKLKVSGETIRRDLNELEREGKLKKVYGGAVSAKKQYLYGSYHIREITSHDKKTAIAKKAVSLVKDGDTVAIDSGTTGAEIAKAICKSQKKVTVITYSTEVFDILKNTNVKVLLSGGEYLQNERALVGYLAIEFFEKLHADICFSCISAISEDFFAEDFIIETLPIQKKLIEISEKVFITADSSKFNKRGLLKLTAINETNGVITDNKIDNEIIEKFKNNGYNLIIAD